MNPGDSSSSISRALVLFEAELELANEPVPTANRPEDLPVQYEVGKVRYPLLGRDRWSAPVWVLVCYLLRLVWWRLRFGPRRRG